MTAGLPILRSKAALGWSALSAVAIIATTVPLVVRGPPLLLWNASASVPVGLYVVLPGAKFHHGNLAVSDLPQAARSLAADRQYLPAGVLLIKPVAAMPGSRVCRYGRSLFIDDVWIADAKITDRRHRILPQWQGCRVLNRDELFLANPRVADSFDGRYFGPTRLNLVCGRAWPLLTFRSKTES